MTPYLVGRRSPQKPVTDMGSPEKIPPAASLCAEDVGNMGVVRVLGWGAATFGAGAILGWMAKRVGSR